MGVGNAALTQNPGLGPEEQFPHPPVEMGYLTGLARTGLGPGWRLSYSFEASRADAGIDFFSFLTLHSGPKMFNKLTFP